MVKFSKAYFIPFDFRTVIGGRVCNHGWTEFCDDWLKLDWCECLGQSDIWTSLDGQLCQPPKTFHIIFQMFNYLKFSVELFSTHYTNQRYSMWNGMWKKHFKRGFANCVEVILKKQVKEKNITIFCQCLFDFFIFSFWC